MSEEIRQSIGQHLASFYEAQLTPLPVNLVEWLARLCVAEARAAFNQGR
jgi:hypothetical protein